MSRHARELTAVGAVVATLSLGGAGNAGHALAPVNAGDAVGTCEHRLDQAVGTYTDTTHNRDADGWASVLHPDVTVVFAGGDVLYGKQQTMDWARGFFADPHWTQTFDERTRVVDGCRSGFVLFDSVYTSAPGADPKPLVIGLTFTYEHGRWLVLHNQDSNGPSVGTPAQ